MDVTNVTTLHSNPCSHREYCACRCGCVYRTKRHWFYLGLADGPILYSNRGIFSLSVPGKAIKTEEFLPFII